MENTNIHGAKLKMSCYERDVCEEQYGKYPLPIPTHPPPHPTHPPTHPPPHPTHPTPTHHPHPPTPHPPPHPTPVLTPAGFDFLFRSRPRAFWQTNPSRTGLNPLSHYPNQYGGIASRPAGIYFSEICIKTQQFKLHWNAFETVVCKLEAIFKSVSMR